MNIVIENSCLDLALVFEIESKQILQTWFDVL